MKSSLITIFALLALTAWAAAQQAGQGSASASGNASVQAGQGQAVVSASQNANTNAGIQPSGGAQVGLASGATIQAELSKSLDAKKAKEGQEVIARTTQDVLNGGKIVIPRGSKMIGHVTQAKARAKGEGNSESSLGIAFDRAELKHGRQVPLHAVIQALAAPQVAAMPDTSIGMGAPPPMASGGPESGAGGGMVGGAVGAAGNTVGQVGSAAGGITGNVGDTAAGSVNGAATPGAGRLGASLGAHSTGVVGLKGLSLNPQSTTAAEGSVITSSGKDVKLEGGTQMVLRVVPR